MDLSLEEASEQIGALMQPEEPEPVAEAEHAPVIPDAPTPEPDYIAQARSMQPQLAAYQQELANEAAAIKALESDARSFRKDNPGEYAARMADIQMRQNKLNQANAEFSQYVGSLEKSVYEQHTQAHKRKLETERQILERELGWNREKQAQLVSHLKSKGYSDQEIYQVSDAKTVKLAWQAMQAEKSARKKILPQKKTDPRLQAEAEIRRRNLGSGSLQAAQERIMALGILK